MVKVVKKSMPKFVSFKIAVRYHKVYMFALDNKGVLWEKITGEGSYHNWEQVVKSGGKATISDTED